MNVPPNTLESPAPQPPRRKPLRLIVTAVSALTLAAVGTVAHFGFQGRDAGAVTASGAVARQEARQALSAFLAAPSAETRSNHVIAGDKLLPLMQAWYASHEMEALSVEAFQDPGWIFSSPSADLVALEYPRDRGRSPVVACFKKSDTGAWLMDWEIWTQSLDGQFRNFINRPAEGEQTLRARLARNHSGTGMKITVADPFDAAQVMEFDISRTDLLALYKRDLPETGSRTATVQLVWLNDSLTGTLTPSLRRHVCWGYPGLDGQEPEEVVINMVSKNRPPPGVAPVPLSVLANGPKIDAAVKTALAPVTTGALQTTPVSVAGDIETAQK